MTESHEPFLPEVLTTTTIRPSAYDSLVAIIGKSLRSESGVRYQLAQKKDAAYYVGRRSGFVVSAAVLLEQMYSVGYDEAKAIVSAAVNKAGEEMPEADMFDAVKTGQRATEIATYAIEYR